MTSPGRELRCETALSALIWLIIIGLGICSAYVVWNLCIVFIFWWRWIR